jgi:methylated-DNA-[protein]-cysteine S-methyltransferase
MKANDIKPPLYTLLPSAFGIFSLVWRETEKGPKVHRVLFPHEHTPAGARLLSCPAIAEVGERILSLLGGEAVYFDLGIIALERCSEFQKRVLLAEYGIPRGWISTNGRIARTFDTPGGARAVGGALARNPFPIIIPCHRAIRANGELGGFRGGLEMKRALLELEGVKFSQAGKVLMDRIYY